LDELAAEAPSLPNIALPVFRSLKVAGYELFPGVGNAGIDRPILPGVTVIAGVNGLGKTTLLNVMLRLLVGPSILRRSIRSRSAPSRTNWLGGNMPDASSGRG